jgi:short-subunit dehydrogenase involved in D-alanine esterification of teichoic acids
MTHSAFIVSIFDELRVLPPSTKETIEETEASVRAKLQEFSSPSAEVVE